MIIQSPNLVISYVKPVEFRGTLLVSALEENPEPSRISAEGPTTIESIVQEKNLYE